MKRIVVLFFSKLISLQCFSMNYLLKYMNIYNIYDPTVINYMINSNYLMIYISKTIFVT